MRNKTFQFITMLVIVSVMLMAFTILPSQPAQEEAPVDPLAPTAGQIVLDMALMVAITAFLKSTFNVTGKPVMAIAFGVGVILWGAPLVSAAFPAVGIYLDSFLAFLKIWLGAMGSVDLVTNVGAKIATARLAAVGKISTGDASKNAK